MLTLILVALAVYVLCAALCYVCASAVNSARIECGDAETVWRLSPQASAQFCEMLLNPPKPSPEVIARFRSAALRHATATPDCALSCERAASPHPIIHNTPRHSR